MLRPTARTALVTLMLAVAILGCGKKETAEQVAATKADSPKTPAQLDKTPLPTNGGKDSQAKQSDPVRDSNDGPQAQPATQLTRLKHDGIVIFYKGFTEDQMKAYLNHIRKYWPTILEYQLLVAKQDKGMRIVREKGSTKIMVPGGVNGDRQHMNGMILPLMSLGKIDESAKGKIAFAICDDDLNTVFQATDRFNTAAKLPPWSPEVEGAVQAIKKLGGTIVVEDKTVPGSPIIGVTFQQSGVTGDKLEPLTKIATLREVRFALCSRLTDISTIAEIADLRVLSLQKCGQINDAGLEPLTRLRKLEALTLPSSITDDGLRIVAGVPSLKRLELNENHKITDAGMAHVARLPALTHLTISQKVGDAGLARLAGHPTLESLDCSQCHDITDAGLRPLLAVPNLRELDLRGGQKLTDAGLDTLAASKSLKTLRLPKLSRKITDQGVIRLTKAIPGLDVQR